MARTWKQVLLSDIEASEFWFYILFQVLSSADRVVCFDFSISNGRIHFCFSLCCRSQRAREQRSYR